MAKSLFSLKTIRLRNLAVPLVALAVILAASAAYATTTIGTDITTDGALTVNGTTTLGNAVADTAIVNSRVSTGSAAGTALDFGSTYTYGEAMELRSKVSDWTGIGSAFRGMYVRSEFGVASSGKGITGIEAYGVDNNFGGGDVTGVRAYGYVKGTTAKTVGPVYGLHGELTFDAGASTKTITTEASAGLLKITGGVVDTFTKLHGLIVRAGDMDGQSRTYGNGILVQDDGDMAGTITWTRGLKLSSPSTADIELQNAETIDNATDGGVKISGWVRPYASTSAPSNPTEGSLAVDTAEQDCFDPGDGTDGGSLCAYSGAAWIVVATW